MYPQVFGKYVLERELAKGGMARVVLATLRGAGGFEKRLVVKQIRDDLACDEDFVRRFVEEAKTTVALAHPNIVPVYELGVELGTYFLAMELVEGASLAEILRSCSKEGKLISPDEGAYVGVEVCRALDYAHRRMNVVHSDVTPRNVMVDEEGQVKVIDFGISAPVATTQEGRGVFGSPGHMPPEQVEGRNLTPAADVFAVAVLLMELWSGKAPFRRHTNEAIAEAMKGPHPKPSDADPRLLPLDDVLASALSLDPKARPQQAEDLGRALRKFLSGVDLGDVARQLGERVRRVRASPLPPSSEKKPILQRPPSRPSAMTVGTRTFAAREEVVPTDAGAGTRRLVSENPPAPPPESAGSERADSNARSEPAGSESADSNAPKEIETVATRPIETDPRDQKTGPVEPKKRGAAWIGVVAGGGIAVAAFFLGRGAGSSVTTPTESPSAPTMASIAPSSRPLAPSIALSVATGARSAPTSQPSAPATADSTGGAGTSALESGSLLLLGDGTTAAIDGVTRGKPPFKAVLEAGTHTVSFTFPATGESKGTTVIVKPGERVTLRADFTGATPTIRVTR